jgi:hypothetical protein
MSEEQTNEETTNELMNDAWQSPPDPETTQDDEVVGGEPVGADNIRDGTVRGTMHGGASKSEGQGQGG